MSAVKTRIMYIQQGRKAGRIGRVRLSKTGRTLYYGALVLESLAGRGDKANFIDVATNETYWVTTRTSPRSRRGAREARARSTPAAAA